MVEQLELTAVSQCKHNNVASDLGGVGYLSCFH